VSDPVRQIADAVLYEGYILWPYRRSALKNQRRWTFGGVHPEAHSAAHPDDRSRIVGQCLLEGGDPADVEVSVRFLHVVRRDVLRPDGEPVDELVAGGERHLAWDEAVERELAPGPIAVAGGREEERLDGGSLARSWEALAGAVDVSAEPLGEQLSRLTVSIVNRTPWAGGAREDVLRRTFCSTHAVLRTRRGGFVSLTDPPESLREAADGCHNEGTWPVLVGAPGSRDTLLFTPIILEDHPRIAPESPGDLFDGGEIDQLLILNILTLTDEEKAEMRDSDPRTREILERTERLTPDELMRLHGAIRELQVVRER
jgi:hydrogenase maturation protease